MHSVKALSELSVTVSWVNAAAVAAVLSKSRAPATARHVLLVLATHASPNGTAWPSVGRLAALTGRDVRTVTRALRTLEALGEITVLRQAGKHGTNLYRIEALVEKQDAEGMQGGGSVPSEGALAARAPRGGRVSPGGGRVPPEKNREKRIKKSPSPFPSPKRPVAAGEKKTRPPTQEEEVVEKSKQETVSSNQSPERALPKTLQEKAGRVRRALGEDLAAALAPLFDSPRRLGLWLATALYPELERLGDAAFRAVIEHYLPQAAGAGIRYPGRFLVAMLKRENPPPPVSSPVPKVELEVFVAEVSEEETGVELDPDNPFARYLRCSYGDHRRGPDCCVPRALRTYADALASIEQHPGLSPEERAGLLRDLGRARRRLETATEDELREAEALTGLQFETLAGRAAVSVRPLRPVPKAG